MSDIVIKAENVGKSYIIGHEKQERYTTLRDVLTNKVKQISSKTSQILKGGQLITGNELEEFWALKDVNFEIRQGDRLGIIGSNGAGKSTLLKVLSRITEPTTGKIQIKGRVASLLEVGTGFHPELSGRENIFLNGAILGMNRTEIKKKFDEIVDFSGVEKFLDTPVKRYSSGMYVRLAFAVAAHLETEILVIDEVLAVGDAEFQKKCLGKMEDISTKEGRTVLFVSHNMSAIRQLCKTAIILDKGTVTLNSTVNECIESYSSSVSNNIGLLLDHHTKINSAIKITEFTINESSADFIHLANPFEPLKIDMKLIVSDLSRLSLYGYLKSKQGQTIGIFSPGHMDAIIYTLKPGIHILSALLLLPNLTKGTYTLDLGIADPGIESFAHFPFALTLQIDGTPAKTGLVFEENSINGFLVLGGSVNITNELEI
jgi:lipopolysaccharide transport system ATP-binding protein